MKKLVVIIGLLLFAFNIFVGLLVSSYPLFNMIFNCAVICVGMVLTMATLSPQLKSGFRVSLPFIFAFISIVQLVLGFISKGQINDNWCAIVIVALLLFEVGLLIIAKFISNINQ